MSAEISSIIVIHRLNLLSETYFGFLFFLYKLLSIILIFTKKLTINHFKFCFIAIEVKIVSSK